MSSHRFTRSVEIIVFSWRAWKYARRADKNTLWIAHDLYALPITFLLAKLSGGLLVYDAVEMSLGRLRKTSPGWLSRRLILAAEGLCRRADCVLSGSPYLSKELMARHRHVKPVLFLNAYDGVALRERSDY